MRLTRFKDALGISMYEYINPKNVQELTVNFNLTKLLDQPSLKNFVNLTKLSVKLGEQNVMPILK